MLELFVPIEEDLQKKFELALQLNGEEKDGVLSRLISDYCSEVFLNASKELGSDKSDNKVSIIQDENHGKANRKIPKWAKKPHQNNYRIIRGFLELEEEIGTVTVEALARKCSESELFPETFSTDFRGNFAQMKTDASNSHGKVFEVHGNVVTIWQVIEESLRNYKEDFLKEDVNEMSSGKITNRMVEEAYVYAKKVYHKEMTRSEGKTEIARITRMNIGSAQDFITDFLAMMEGKEYHRTMSNYATKYYLENIENDYGKEYFLKALEATEKHIKYYNQLGYGQLKAKAVIVKNLRDTL